MSIFDVVRRIGASAFEASTSASPESGGVDRTGARPRGRRRDARGRPSAQGRERLGRPPPWRSAPAATSGSTACSPACAGRRAISYSDPDSAADYQAGHPEAFSNFQQINAAQLAGGARRAERRDLHPAARRLQLLGRGLHQPRHHYDGTGTGSGTIRLANTSTRRPPTPTTRLGGLRAATPSSAPPARNRTAGNYDYHTIIHELGHSLGLKHGHETNVYGALPAPLRTRSNSR